MGVNANAIKNFNQKKQQQQQGPTPTPTPTPTPADDAVADFLGKNKQQPTVSNNPTIKGKMSASDIQLLQADVNTLTDEQKLRRKALETKTNLEEIEKAKLEVQQKAEQQARDEGNQQEILVHELGKAFSRASDHPAKLWFENVPTPGGIGLLLLVIAVFLLAIVPVDSSGHTRLMLIWLTLTRKTHLSYGQNGGGAGGTFSATTPAPTPTPAPVQTSTPIPTNVSFPSVDLGITGLFL